MIVFVNSVETGIYLFNFLDEWKNTKLFWMYKPTLIHMKSISYNALDSQTDLTYESDIVLSQPSIKI